MLDPLYEDLIEGLEGAGNREVVDDDINEPIDYDTFDMVEVLEGGDFDYVECPEEWIHVCLLIHKQVGVRHYSAKE